MPDDRLENALHFAKLGFKLFPAKYKKEEHKHQGLIKWKANSTNDPERITAWAKRWSDCYFCVNLNASGLTVIDLDVKGEKDGISVFHKILEPHDNKEQVTLEVHTPSGGLHLYYKGISAVTVNKIGKGVDTPGMVPIPNSTVSGKGKYPITMDWKVAPLPPWLSELIGKPRERKAGDEDVQIQLDIEYNVKRAVEYLIGDAPVAVEGDGGDATTYGVVCRIRELGLSKDKAYELMYEHWNRYCQPMWSAKDLREKVENAYEYAQNAIGCDTIEYEDLSIREDEEPLDNGVRALKDMQHLPLAREWIIDQWLPVGEVCAFYGSGGLGKSRLAIQLGLHISSGLSVFDLPVATKMPVLYVPCEDGEDEVHRRVHSIMTHADYDLTMNYGLPFYSMSRAANNSIMVKQNKRTGNLVKGKFYEILKETVQRLFKGERALLIFDTLTDIFKVDMNDPMISSQCVKHVLARFAKELNLTILVIAHPSKTGLITGTLDSGSPGWLNSFRLMMAMVAHESKALRDYSYLKMVKSNYSRLQEPILIRYDEGILTNEDTENIIDEAREQNIQNILTVIRRYQTTIPVGLHALNKNSLKNIRVVDANGGVMTYQIKVNIVNELMDKGVIVEVSGQKRKNGLKVVEGEEK